MSSAGLRISTLVPGHCAAHHPTGERVSAIYPGCPDHHPDDDDLPHGWLNLVSLLANPFMLPNKSSSPTALTLFDHGKTLHLDPLMGITGLFWSYY
jgi:hypothetical protein